MGQTVVLLLSPPWQTCKTPTNHIDQGGEEEEAKVAKRRLCGVCQGQKDTKTLIPVHKSSEIKQKGQNVLDMMGTSGGRCTENIYLSKSSNTKVRKYSFSS